MYGGGGGRLGSRGSMVTVVSRRSSWCLEGEPRCPGGMGGEGRCRTGFQPKLSTRGRRVTSSRRAAEGSWSPCATAVVSGRRAGRSHRPSSPLPHHVVCPRMFYFIVCLGFFPLF